MEDIESLTHAHGGADATVLLKHADAVRWIEDSRLRAKFWIQDSRLREEESRLRAKFNTNEIKGLINIFLKDGKELLKQNGLADTASLKMDLLHNQVALLLGRRP